MATEGQGLGSRPGQYGSADAQRRMRVLELTIEHFKANPGTAIGSVLVFAKGLDRFVESGETP